MNNPNQDALDRKAGFIELATEAARAASELRLIGIPQSVVNSKFALPNADATIRNLILSAVDAAYTLCLPPEECAETVRGMMMAKFA